ncbi:hypothetical protein BDF14DRAFT_1773398 [Spinellus fusiger]|nr:hypothetical protein BDF14DRAFT_1773398 [Spinellus fusiger]
MKSSRDLIVASLLAFFPVVLIIASLISIPVNHIYNQFKKWYFRGPTDTPQPHYLLDHLTHPSHTRLLSQHNTIQSLFIQLVESILCQLSSVLAIPSREHHPSLYTYSLWISVITLILYSIFQKVSLRPFLSFFLSSSIVRNRA